MTALNTPVFSSAYSSRMYDFVEYKRLCGYKYNGEVKELQRLDRFFLSHELTPENCSDELVYAWLRKRPHESDKTFSTRNSVYQQFYMYLSGFDEDILPKPLDARLKYCKNGFTPYIFTHDQIRNIFNAVDHEHPSKGRFMQCAPLLFRILYGTGLRVNEALSLTGSDVNLDQGYLIIQNSKNDNSRLVPMSKSLVIRMDKYLIKYGCSSDKPLFQNGMDNSALNSRTVYQWFRLSIHRAGIPHRGRGHGPRLHDLRHTFAVHSLQASVARGEDPNAFLPILCTYMGHSTLSSTERYLRLTSEVYPEVSAAMDEVMGFAIPEVEDYER